MPGPVYRDENGKPYVWGANGKPQYLDTEPIASCGCLLVLLIFCIVVGWLLAIFIFHAAGVRSLSSRPVTPGVMRQRDRRAHPAGPAAGHRRLAWRGPSH